MRVVPVLWLFLVLSRGVMCAKKPTKRPHIMIILADDWGWGDVGWGESGDIHTPKLRELRNESLELMQFYSQPKCTAARAALMTARYPYKMGLQTNDVFSRSKNNTLDPKYKILPEYFKDLGYHTHMVGKWHLGHCNVNATPIYRGFDSHFGSWGNTENHFNLTVKDTYEWNWQNKPYWQAKGTFTAHLIANHTQFMLRKHFNDTKTKKEPLFMYVANLLPHKPAMAPEKYKNGPKCGNISEDVADGLRRPYCGMVAAMDEGIGNITDTLRDLGVLNKFIIIFTSDNGGAMRAGASNWPLRGNKQTVYEGGTRVRTLLRAPNFLEKKHKRGEYHGLVHITDLLPSLLEAAKIKGDSKVSKRVPGDLDGINSWKFIKKGKPTEREWMVYNIDSERKLGAIRFKNATHNFKLIYSNATKREPGYRSYDPRNDTMKALDPVRRRYKRGEDEFYFMFNLTENPNERPASNHTDALEANKDMFEEMKTKLTYLTETYEVPVIKYWGLTPGFAKIKNGSWQIGGC